MGIRRWFDRIRKVLVWGLGIGLLVLGSLAALLLFTPLADDMGKAWLSQVLRERGISLRVGETRGTLARGLEVRDLLLEKPGRWRFTARRADLELSLFSLLAARPQLSELRLEGAHFEARLEGGEGEARPRYPRLGISRWVVRGGSVRLTRRGEALPWLGEWSHLEGEGGFAMGGESLRLSARSLEGVPGDPRLPPLQAAGSATWARGPGLGLDLRAAAAGSSLSLRGRMESGARGATWAGEVRARDVDLALLRPLWPQAPSRRGSGEFSVKVQGGELTWEGPVELPGSGRAQTRGSLTLREGEAATAGEARLQDFALGTPPLLEPLAELAPEGSGTVRWSATRRGGVPWAWELELDLGASRVHGLPLTGWRGKVQERGEGLVVAGAGESPQAASLAGEARRDPEGVWRARAQGAGVELEPFLRALGFWRDLPAPFRVPPGPWPALQMELTARREGLELTARGTSPGAAAAAARFELALPKGGSAAWSLEAQALDFAACGSPVPGKSDLRLDYAAAPGASLRCAWGQGQVAGETVEAGNARLRWEGETVRLEPALLRGPKGQVEVEGTLAPDGLWEGRVSAHLSDLSPAARWAGLEGATGTLETALQIRLRGEALRLAGQVTLGRFAWGSASGEGVRAAGRWDPGDVGSDLALSWQSLSWGKRRVGEGRLELSGPPAQTRARLTADLGGGRSLSAAAVGRLGASGGEMRLSESALTLADLAVRQEGEALLGWDPRSLSLEGFSLRGSGGRVALSLRAGLGLPWPQTPLSGALVAEGVPLGLVALPETAGRLGGTLSADLAWDGTVGAPGLSGTVRLREGSYSFARSDLTWSPVEMDFQAEGDRLHLVRAEVSSPEGGRAQARGWVSLEGFVPGPFEFHASGKSMPFVVGRDLGGASDFEVTLSGTLAAPHIEGGAQILKGRLQLPDLARQAPLPESIRFVRAPAGSPFAPPAEPETPLVGPLRGAVTLRSGGGFWVTSQVLLAEVSGTITARFTDRGLVLEGTLKLTEGRYLLQGRTLEITRADLFFDGSPENVPALDVTAVYRAVEEVEITVRVLGRPEKPKVLLSSRPALPQSEILALLITGKRPGEMDEGQKRSWSGAAAALALQYEAGPLLDAVRQQLGLETLSLVTGDTPDTAGVGFSKAVGDRMVVEYQQLFGALPEERLDLRYRINRRLAFRARTSSVEGSGADLLWEQRY